jgi:predicted exporter
MTPQPPQPIDEAELRKKLAAIEHERWASWQIWCNRVIRDAVPDNPALEAVLKRWDRQIDLPYQYLSDKEKASDMEQVDRYWPLIKVYTAQAVTAALKRVDAGLPDKKRGQVIGRDSAAMFIAEIEQARRDGFNDAVEAAHQVITNELPKWGKAE